MGERSGRVGGVDRRRRPQGLERQRLEHLVEEGELLGGEVVERIVGDREVCVDARQAQSRRTVDDRRGERGRLTGMRAHALHAGVDLEVHGQFRAPGGS